MILRGPGTRGSVVIGSLLAAALLGSTGAVSAAPPRLHGDMVWPAGKKRAPGFRLRDERGRMISLAGERGRIVLLTFMYSRCREICPLEGRLLAAVERRIGPSRRSLLLVVSVDPGGDVPATIRRFVRRAGLAGARWHWLVGSKAQLAPVWRAYRIEVQAGRNIGHGTGLYLLDRRGYERSGYAVPFMPQLVAADVRTLAHGNG